MPAAARPTVAICAAALALVIPGCGGGGSEPTGTIALDPPRSATAAGASTTAATTTAAAKRRRPDAAPAGARCESQLGGFISSMDALRRRLAVGVTYEQYVDEIHAIRDTYGKIEVDRLPVDCLGAAGTPAEDAFNRYIDGADRWGECIEDSACDSAQIEPVLQRKWRLASHLLREAERGMRQVDG